MCIFIRFINNYFLQYLHDQNGKCRSLLLQWCRGAYHPNNHEGVEILVKHDYTDVKNIYIICGKTDMRKGIDGLATLIQDSLELDPYGDSIFLFAGWKKDRYKCLLIAC
jgi:hypothetical protein